MYGGAEVGDLSKPEVCESFPFCFYSPFCFIITFIIHCFYEPYTATFLFIIHLILS